MPLKSLTEIADVVHAALMHHGASPRAARIMTEAIGWAEARGNRICGLYYLESYCLQLRSGRLNAMATPRVTTSRPASLVVDADYGFAQVAFDHALDQAVAAAKDYGIAQLMISHSHTCTALGWFTETAAADGLIALGMTNATPIVAPPGGSRRVIGTNPIACAMPDGEGGVAIAFDQSTSAVALGRITMAKAAGEPIPEGWAVDAQGAPTTDPEAALDGALVSSGGYKGWGIGLMVELLSAGMTGGLPSHRVAPLKAVKGAPHDLGQFFILIDPDAGMAFGERMRAVFDEVDRDTCGRIPGRNRTLLSQIEVPDALWSLCSDLATG